jgi:hypothetical protein
LVIEASALAVSGFGLGHDWVNLTEMGTVVVLQNSKAAFASSARCAG